MSTKGLLILIAVLLVGILGVVVLEATEESPAEQMADDFGSLTEDIGNRIQSSSANGLE